MDALLWCLPYVCNRYHILESAWNISGRTQTGNGDCLRRESGCCRTEVIDTLWHLEDFVPCAFVISKNNFKIEEKKNKNKVFIKPYMSSLWQITCSVLISYFQRYPFSSALPGGSVNNNWHIEPSRVCCLPHRIPSNSSLCFPYQSHFGGSHWDL